MKSWNIEELQKIFPHMNFSWIQELKIITEKIKKPWNFVGGCVRDSLLGIKTLDIDINTYASPEEIEEYMQKFSTSVVGKKFGTIGVFFKKWKIEITTTREDIRTYGRKADVEFVTNFETDSSRRDFTINALMFDGEKILDYHNGIFDLQEGKVLFINDAEKRIQEDYLRILRYVRFLCRFSKNFDYSIYENVIKKNLDGLKNISIERIISEIYGMCKYPNTSKAIEVLNGLKISELIFQKNLNTEINDNWNQDKKMAFIFIFLEKNQWKKLPINKSAKIYLEVSVFPYEDIFMNFAFFWNRFHDLEKADLFLEVYNTLNDKNEKIVVKNFEVNYDILNSFEDQKKGQVSFIMKYFHLTNQEISKENIEKFLQ
jgi:tRNA nucleotidyltransferase/poly(A) polymerase